MFYSVTKSCINNNYFNFSSFNCLKRINTFAIHSKMNNSSECKFKIENYDCIGFDLDHTLCEYKLGSVIKMEYDTLINVLVEKFNYKRTIFNQNVNFRFLQRGLLLDLNKGNILKINYNGKILRGYHGTKAMSDQDIIDNYGTEKRWINIERFYKNPIEILNSTNSSTVLDYFDIPVLQLFAQIVDFNDSLSEYSKKRYHEIGEHVISSLVHLYTKENYENKSSQFFNEIKQNPQKYFKKCHPELKTWLKKLKKTKKTFLISGSYVDYVSFTATHCLGSDWNELFDVIICFSQKPGFFISNKPFYNKEETDIVKENDLTFNSVYTQGNWSSLYQLFRIKCNIDNPKCLYFGDNLIQDVYATSLCHNLDSVTVLKEYNNEEILEELNIWGSFLMCNNSKTLWLKFLTKYTKMCIPSLNVLIKKPLSQEFETFEKDCFSGFYPKKSNVRESELLSKF